MYDDDDEGDHMYVQQGGQMNPPMRRVPRVQLPNRRYHNDDMINNY